MKRTIAGLPAEIFTQRDFVVILAPTATLLRPITVRAEAHVDRYYKQHKHGIFKTLAFGPEEFNVALEKLSLCGLTVEVL